MRREINLKIVKKYIFLLIERIEESIERGEREMLKNTEEMCEYSHSIAFVFSVK